MDGVLETRELAHFLAVADELHFSRAAARLGIAQPALSKTIQRLERRLGVVLFERTSRAVTLTPAGQVLAREARHALDAVDAAARRTRRADDRDPHLILAMKAGGDAGLLPAVLAACEREPHSLPVRVVFQTDRVRLLRDGHADAALLFSPADDLRGLDTEPLLTEPRMAVLPASHPLATRASLRTADLREEHVHGQPGPPAGPEAASVTELMQLIALGQTVAVVPRSLTRAMPLRHDLTSVPVTDAPPVTLLLAWPAHSTSPAIAALARAVRTACPGGVMPQSRSDRSSTMALRADLTALLADAGIVDVDIDKAVDDEHVRTSAYLKVLAVLAAAERRDDDRAVVATILRDPEELVSTTAVVELVDTIALKTNDPADFHQWATGLMSETDQLTTDGHRSFLHRRVHDWTTYLTVMTGHTPTAVELAGVTDWMQRKLATESTSPPVLAILTETGSTRKIRNIARTRATSQPRE